MSRLKGRETEPDAHSSLGSQQLERCLFSRPGKSSSAHVPWNGWGRTKAAGWEEMAKVPLS